MDYPVLDVLSSLKEELRANRVVLLQAPPGAGKSTILPLHLFEESWLSGKKIIMLEPRRLAAKSVAERMAELRNEKVGETAGYRVRFESKVSPRTRIEVVTEGILTRMLQSDNSLEDVGLVIFDEFHERNLQGDLALALTLQIREVLREDLRILMMSATIDTESISNVLGKISVVTSEGKQFPVEVRYDAQASDSHIAPRVVQAIRKALREESGDILVFLPGAGEIKRAEDLLQESNPGAVIHPLYGDLPFRQQQDAILPRKDGQRKIVLATSIAETSLTIEGVRVVIDGGLARVPRFDPRSGLTRLETVKVTRDSADQRKGRAGRLGPGVCYRLWTEAVHRNLLPQRKPEILEADLSTFLLELTNWGIKDMDELRWVTPPPAGAVSQARELLTQLGALDKNEITPRGEEMVALPTHPRISHMLLSAVTEKEKSLACDIAALIEERDFLGKEAGADLRLRVEAFRRFRAGERGSGGRMILERVDRLAANFGRMLNTKTFNDLPGDAAVGKLLAAAYPERIARQQRKQGLHYTLANGRVVKLPDHDPLMHDPWLCVAQLDSGTNEGRIFLAAPVDEEDLIAQAIEQRVIRWDEERGMVVSAVEKRIGGVLLQSRALSELDEEEKNGILVEKVIGLGLKTIGWDEAAASLQARMQSLKIWRPVEEWPDVSEENLLKTVSHWLPPYLGARYKLAELGKIDCVAILGGFLPWNLQDKVDRLAPQRIQVPSGSWIRLQYFQDGRAPVMEVRLQEMFGLAETPAINEGRTKVLLHLLSPGYKPVQVTQDLKNFWHSTYHEVRKELRMRYPKHSWPEDPWTAIPIKGAKKKRG